MVCDELRGRMGLEMYKELREVEARHRGSSTSQSQKVDEKSLGETETWGLRNRMS